MFHNTRISYILKDDISMIHNFNNNENVNIDRRFFKTKNIYEFIFNTIITYFQAISLSRGS